MRAGQAPFRGETPDFAPLPRSAALTDRRASPPEPVNNLEVAAETLKKPAESLRHWGALSELFSFGREA